MITSPPGRQNTLRWRKKKDVEEGPKKSCQLTDTFTRLQVLFKYHYVSDDASSRTREEKKVTEGVAFYRCRAECERKGGPYIWSSVWMCMVQADKRFAQSRFNGGGSLLIQTKYSVSQELCRAQVTSFLLFFLLYSFYLVKKRPKAEWASSSWVTAMCRQWASQPSLSSARDVLSTTANAIYLLSGSWRKSLIFSKDRIDAAIVAGCVSHTWQLDWTRTIEHCRAKCICSKV